MLFTGCHTECSAGIITFTYLATNIWCPFLTDFVINSLEIYNVSFFTHFFFVYFLLATHVRCSDLNSYYQLVHFTTHFIFRSVCVFFFKFYYIPVHFDNCILCLSLWTFKYFICVCVHTIVLLNFLFDVVHEKCNISIC